MVNRKTLQDIKKRLEQVAPKVRLIMEPIPTLTVDGWEALSQRHHEKMLYGGIENEH